MKGRFWPNINTSTSLLTYAEKMNISIFFLVKKLEKNKIMVAYKLAFYMLTKN